MAENLLSRFVSWLDCWVLVHSILYFLFNEIIIISLNSVFLSALFVPPPNFFFCRVFLSSWYMACTTRRWVCSVSQGWLSEWEKWQVSDGSSPTGYRFFFSLFLFLHMGVPLPFMLGLTYMHPGLPLTTDTQSKELVIPQAHWPIFHCLFKFLNSQPSI